VNVAAHLHLARLKKRLKRAGYQVGVLQLRRNIQIVQAHQNYQLDNGAQQE